MPRVRIYGARAEGLADQEYRFTVFFEPLLVSTRSASQKGPPPRKKNPAKETGYQVTVPLLPGLITYGRTLAEARRMARDAIRCHLEGMRKAGEPIPEERYAHSEKLRIALTA